MSMRKLHPAIHLIGLLLMIWANGCRSSPSPGDEAAPPGSLAYDRNVFGQLLDKHRQITRQWHPIEGGIESLTESDDPIVSALIVDHVQAMKVRVESGARIRQWDPMFKAVFDEAEQGKIEMTVEPTPKGVRVRETSSDPAVIALIRAHAGVVSAFVQNGPEEATRSHPVP